MDNNISNLLKQVTSDPKKGNTNCFECFSDKIQWASVNHGIVLCLECALAHKSQLSPGTSFIKSLDMPYWSKEEVNCMVLGGNTNFKNFLESYEIKELDLVKKYQYNCVEYYRVNLSTLSSGGKHVIARPNLKEGQLIKSLNNFEYTNNKTEGVNDSPGSSDKTKDDLINDLIISHEKVNRTVYNKYQNRDDDIEVSNIDLNKNLLEEKNLTISQYNCSSEIKSPTDSNKVNEDDIIEDFKSMFYDGIGMLKEAGMELDEELEKRGIKQKIKQNSEAALNFIDVEGTKLKEKIVEKSNGLYSSMLKYFSKQEERPIEDKKTSNYANLD